MVFMIEALGTVAPRLTVGGRSFHTRGLNKLGGRILLRIERWDRVDRLGIVFRLCSNHRGAEGAFHWSARELLGQPELGATR